MPTERPLPVVVVTWRPVITYVSRFCHPGLIEVLSGDPIDSSIAPERSVLRSFSHRGPGADRTPYSAALCVAQKPR